jgi:hypothetical protein
MMGWTNSLISGMVYRLDRDGFAQPLNNQAGKSPKNESSHHFQLVPQGEDHRPSFDLFLSALIVGEFLICLSGF